MAGTPAATPRGQADPARDEKARRVRNLLSSYYGAADAGGAPEASPEQPGTPSRAAARAPLAPRATAGLDSTTFDADRYLAQLLRSTRLDALLAKHAEVSTEIRSLDSDMQMLVYENYNKFISATDTIRSMKSNVDGMDSNMQELQSIIVSVSERSNGVNAKLQLRRDQIEELNQVRELLAKLQAVFDLPRRLHTAIARGALELAVGYYADAAPLLRRYGHKARPAGAVTGLSGQACLFQAGGVLVSGETA